MSVWVVCPSKRPAEHVKQWAKAWRNQGYCVGLLRDDNWGLLISEPGTLMLNADGGVPYKGYARSVNRIVAGIMERDETAEWFIAAGDDIYPDPNKSADEIAGGCVGYFTKLHYGNEAHHAAEVGPLSTFGVMQPTGDRFGEDPNAQDPKMRSAYIDRVAGSAWIGREFARRMYQGNGPLWSGYTHQFVDEELQNVAIKYGVFWQRPDLTQLHQHWGRPKPGERMGHASNMPDFLKEANSPEHWDKFRKLFEQRKAAGFPGSEPL